MRLQKLLANAGVASRRKAEELISAGRVRVNGKVVTELGAKATASDEITVDGVPLAAASKKKYIMLHKPEKVVTTVSDQFGRATVMDYVPRDVRLFPVGRLDYETSGLILLTNDGDWANTLMHPSNEVNKTYIAVIHGKPTPAALQAFRTGITIEGRRTAPCKIATAQATQPLFADDMHSKPHKRHEASNSPHADTTVKITIHEGR
ncbi:MAG: rRNA pseudouridine synthase, partial [Defluviitaleaceae bacterium]|nr:rRNA pseudouridine synthase [Defluviitaleaceae bacterium]